MSTNGIIYKATNNVNGKVYVGKTTIGLSKRIGVHIHDAEIQKYGSIFHRALIKYGPQNFSWFVLEHCQSEHALNLAEEWYIKKYKTFTGFNDCKGYNLTLGGDGVSWYRHSEDIRRKISRANSGKKRTKEHSRKLAVANRGKVISKESRLKMSIARKGIKFSEEHRRKISESKKGVKRKPFTEEARMNMSLSKKGKRNAGNEKIYVISFPAGTDFVVKGLNNFCRKYKDVKLWPKFFSSCAKGKLKSYKGFDCRYFDEEKDVCVQHWEDFI